MVPPIWYFDPHSINGFFRLNLDGFESTGYFLEFLCHFLQELEPFDICRHRFARAQKVHLFPTDTRFDVVMGRLDISGS